MYYNNKFRLEQKEVEKMEKKMKQDNTGVTI